MNVAKMTSDMQRKIFFALTLFMLSGVSFCLAQNTAGLSDALSENSELQNDVSEDWTIYADEENKIFYIDFENLTVNLNDIIVRNEAGEIVLSEEVFDLPVNTIYEIDLSDQRAGTYFIELRAFTGMIRKTVSLK